MITLANKTKKILYVSTYKIPALGRLTLASKDITISMKREIRNLVNMNLIDTFESPDVEEKPVETLVEETVTEEPQEETEVKTTRKRTKKQEVEE